MRMYVRTPNQLKVKPLAAKASADEWLSRWFDELVIRPVGNRILRYRGSRKGRALKDQILCDLAVIKYKSRDGDLQYCNRISFLTHLKTQKL